MLHWIATHLPEAGNDPVGDRFRVRFDLVVTDSRALWYAAARVAFRQPGVTAAEIEDVLGPVDDPMVPECVAMLTAPDAMPGCMPLGFSVATVAGPKHPQSCEHTMRLPALRAVRTAGGAVTTQ